MAKEMAPNGQSTDQFSLEALGLGESVRINEAAKRMGIPASSLGKLGSIEAASEIISASPSRHTQSLGGGTGS